MNILILIYFFCFEWQFPTVNISLTSAFISLLFSFRNKNVLFCVENDNNKKESIFNSIEKKITLRLTFASFSTQNN